MVQVNLLPDIKKQLLRAQIQRNLVISVCIVASIAAGSVIAILGGVMGAQALQKNGLTQSIEEKASDIAKKQDNDQLDEYLTIQNQLSKISSLKDKQLNYSRMFDYLKQLNPAAPNSVELSSVKIMSPGIDSNSGVAADAAATTGVTVEMQGETASYSSLNVFKSTLSLAKFSYAPSKGANVETKLLLTSVSVTSTSLSTDGVSFTLQIVFDSAIFDANSVDIKLDIPNETTSDSDRNAPSNIFTTESTKPTPSTTEEGQ